MKRILTTLSLLLAAVLTSIANDGVYYVSGNHLVPIQETAIDVVKEVLTIDICDDGYARVDVYYEMNNRGAAKTIDMGFEATVPYNSGDTFKTTGQHPRIFDFDATLNGEQLSWKTGVVKASVGKMPTDFKPIDTKKWKIASQDEWDMGNNKLSDGKGHELEVAYAYYFRATFKPGINKIHHTYRYQMSSGVYRAFEVPYWLTPATRWANHRIDDFTLRIRALGTAKYFFLNANPFKASGFKVVKGVGKVRKAKFKFTGAVTEITLRDGIVEWHARNFRPAKDMVIGSADQLILEDQRRDAASFYDRGGFFPLDRINYKQFYGREAASEAESDALYRRILRNLPYADRGYVFKDPKLQAYFDAQWWYMPDPAWQMSTDDFTKHDWQFVNEYSKSQSE